MRKYYQLNNRGVIVGTTDLNFPQEGQEIFDFPDDFDFMRQSNYRIVDGKLVEVSSREIAAIEKLRPLSEAEVIRMLLTAQVNTIPVDDNTALRMLEFYPEWGCSDYAVGFKVRHGGKLWRCLQAHTGQAGREPENAPSLWEQICESHTGTEDDPIPYSGNMALVSGLYYMQDYTVYRCTRNTGNPVYHALSELVGLYVEST